MARSKHVQAYPKALLELAGEFEGPHGIRQKVLECSDKRAASRMRLDIYAFKAALKCEMMASEYPNFLLVRVYQVDNVLTLMHVDDTWKVSKSANG